MKNIISLMLILCMAHASAVRPVEQKSSHKEPAKLERPAVYAPSWSPPRGHRYT